MFKVKDEKKIILEKITLKKEELKIVASYAGLRSDKTIQCSRELDHLLNLYQSLL